MLYNFRRIIQANCFIIRVDLAGILGGTHGDRRKSVGAEWVAYGEGCPLSSRIGGLGAS